MFAGNTRSRIKRRGIVLIVILGMLGLLALIGVTFATFAGQAVVNTRNYAQSVQRPSSEQLMDFALSQLILDTDNPLSALRGHSLSRDMYGNDSVFSGNLGSQVGGLLTQTFPTQGVNDPSLRFSGSVTRLTNGPFTGYFAYGTNIPTANRDSRYYGLNFTRWFLRLRDSRSAAPGPYVDQSFEVMLDDSSGQFHVLVLSHPDTTLVPDPPAVPTPPQFDHLVYHPYGNYGGSPPIDPNLQNPPPVTPPVIVIPKPVYPAQPIIGSQFLTTSQLTGGSGLLGGQGANTFATFTLDGRYLRGFNGPGISALDHYFKPNPSDPTTWIPISAGRYPNFRLNGNILSFNSNPNVPSFGSPDAVGMDEDYDACDLENWFLAIQSADGQIVVPSFHRPGIISVDLTAPNNAATNDWLNTTSALSAAKFLRPRGVDHPRSNFRNLIPDATTGKIDYDVDNDGDGVTDAVWLDLGYPVQRDANTGRAYKPLFAFTVIGLNGRMPLNTVGNLQARDLNFYLSNSTPTHIVPPNMPMFDHASHLGYSVNEINPKYALQNEASSVQTDNAGVPIWQTQLRNILAGTRPAPSLTGPFNTNLHGERNFVTVAGVNWQFPNGVFDSFDFASSANPPIVERNTPPVMGRWGESDLIPSLLQDTTATLSARTDGWPLYLNYNNPVRAGRSLGGASDYTDDDFDAVDIYPRTVVNAYHPESYNFHDLAGGLALPSERMRRFVTPADTVGVGQVVAFDRAPNYLDQFGTGADQFGRAGFFRYFRPAGLPGHIDHPHTVANSNGQPVVDYTRPWIHGPRLDTSTNPAGVNTNKFHGYDGYRDPKGTGNDIAHTAMGGMPSDFDRLNGDIKQAPTSYPTFFSPPYDPLASGSNIASLIASTPFPGHGLPVRDLLARIRDDTINQDDKVNGAVRNGYPLGLMNRDEADEMNLYANSPLDAPFGPSDLEWLYRRQDVDGGSLDSRLAKLAPVSFLHPTEGTMRRRMFSTDTWETINFAWSPDNPPTPYVNSAKVHPQLTPSLPDYPFAGNNRFPGFNYPTVTLPGTSASIYNLNVTRSTPSVAHFDRKINLNYPLPVSNDPFEPVRVKWIRETYEMMKTILPPQAVDTPQELVELSQFLVNVIDFRDTDCTTTRFVNPDVVLEPGVQHDDASTPPRKGIPPRVVAAGTGSANAVAFEQFGMEYLPVAINEVLAYQFDYKDITNLSQPRAEKIQRLQVELVNTLMDPQKTSASGTCNLTLDGWEAVILDDDETGRPNPYNGQIPIVNKPGLPVQPAPRNSPVPIGPLNPTIPALGSGGSVDNPVQSGQYYYQVGGRIKASSAHDFLEQPALPQVDHQIPALVGQLPQDIDSSTGKRKYMWLYLLRPANPFNTNPNHPEFRRVVADTMRFLYVAGGGTGTTTQNTQGRDTDTIIAGKNIAYSTERIQPFMGGHNVYLKDYDPAHPVYPENPYGYSEQTVPGARDTIHGLYRSTKTETPSSSSASHTTLAITHSLGKANLTGPASDIPKRDYFPFNDRDFSSVAELLLVPGCPPGLFTKKFAEHAPPHLVAGKAYWDGDLPSATTAPSGADIGRKPGLILDVADPQDPQRPRGIPVGAAAAGVMHVALTHPYLPDKFYYSAAPIATHLNGTIGGPSAAGWHKMLEFFEVPSSANGAIGLVQNGVNFDWARQDRKPGLLNLNLIVDQEVFHGLIDDVRVNRDPALTTSTALPVQVNQINPLGYPNAFVPFTNRAFHDPNRNPDPALIGQPSTPIAGMSAAFSDFLKLRHGGSGFVFAHGTGLTGSGSVLQTSSTVLNASPAVERPYRSLSYPDIDFTILRPATLPPAPLIATTTPLIFTTPSVNLLQPDVTTVTAGYYSNDPGVMNPNITPAVIPGTGPVGLIPTGVPQPPPIPFRRLFALADYPIPIETGKFANINAPIYNSNSTQGVAAAPDHHRGQPEVNWPILHPTLSNAFGSLMHASPPQAILLGGNVNAAAPLEGRDHRAHPYFRTELLQKVMNLTTVRTHQYAVWITVGFFEVTLPGSADLGIADQLGVELGLGEGRSTRYRMFAIVDRTRIPGYSPTSPGDFRSAVQYRRTIQ